MTKSSLAFDAGVSEVEECGLELVNDWKNFSTGTLSQIDFFEDERHIIQSNIETIFSFPFANTLDYDLTNILHKIRSSYFYIGVNKYYEFRNSAVPFSYSDFEKYAYEHYQNFLSLIEYQKPKDLK